MKNALTLTEKETFFLKENRQDPVTGDGFDIGDEIVFCASCKSAFLKESWEYMESKHCGQTFTLKKFPIQSKLTLLKPIVYDFKENDIGNRVVAYFIDNVIAILIGFLSYYFFLALKSFFDFDEEFFAYMLGSFYMLFRDVILRKSSIGKRFMGIYFINSKTKQVASVFKLMFRNLIYWFFLFAVISLITILEVVIDADDAIAVVGGFCLVIANITHIIAVLANQNNIFDRMLKIELVENK